MQPKERSNISVQCIFLAFVNERNLSFLEFLSPDHPFEPTLVEKCISDQTFDSALFPAQTLSSRVRLSSYSFHYRPKKLIETFLFEKNLKGCAFELLSLSLSLSISLSPSLSHTNTLSLSLPLSPLRRYRLRRRCRSQTFVRRGEIKERRKSCERERDSAIPSLSRYLSLNRCHSLSFTAILHPTDLSLSLSFSLLLTHTHTHTRRYTYKCSFRAKTFYYPEPYQFLSLSLSLFPSPSLNSVSPTFKISPLSPPFSLPLSLSLSDGAKRSGKCF